MTDDKRSYVRLSPATWAEIRALWETGEPTLAQLSDRYGVTTRAIQAHLEKHGTTKGSAAQVLTARVEAEIYASHMLDPEDLISRARDIRIAAYDGAVRLERLLSATLDAAAADPKATFAAAAAVKMIANASQALERLHSLKRAALGLRDDSDLNDELPTLIIQDMTADDIKAVRRGQDDDAPEIGLGLGYANARSPADDEIVVAS